MHLRAAPPRSVRSLAARLALLAVAPAAAGPWLGCSGTARSVLPDDATFFSVGVTPSGALDEATQSLAALGLRVVTRVDAERFSAASYADDRGHTSLRVVTRRGTGLALDASAEDGALLSLDPRTGRDVTRDGAADVIVVRTEADRTCVALAEVDVEGALRGVPMDAPWLDQTLCVSELLDLDHDARVEALVVVPFPSLGAPAPTITVPFELDDQRVLVHGPWPEAFATAEIARREASLETAIDRRETAVATGVAIELTMIRALRGEEDEASLARVETLATGLGRRAIDDARALARTLRETTAPRAAPAEETSPEETPTDEARLAPASP